jgi:hypothetical protein
MSEILIIYNYANNILNTHILELCIKKGETCPFKSDDLKDRVTSSCCGFIAPALGVVLYFVDINFQNGQIMTPTDIDYAILAGLNFYTRFTGYGTSPYGWTKNCNKFTNFIKEGVNIFSFFNRKNPEDPDVKKCHTTHHFIVYKKHDYCLIIDAWAGMGGFRGPWARIMRSNDLIYILKSLTRTRSLSITNKLLNAYFILPHGINNAANINENITYNLISAGAYNLIDWNKELNALQLQSRRDEFIDFSSDGIDPVSGSPITIGQNEDNTFKDNLPLTWFSSRPVTPEPGIKINLEPFKAFEPNLDLKHLNWRLADVKYSEFPGVNLDGVVFSKTILTGVEMIGANLNNANLRGSIIKEPVNFMNVSVMEQI